MYWLRLSGFFIPLYVYIAVVYGVLAPIEPQARLLFGCVGFLLGGLVASTWHEIEAWFSGPSEVFGSASFATPSIVSRVGLYSKRGVILGRLAGRLIRFNQPGHLLTLAPTRSGKGTCAVIPNLLEYPGSTVVVDIKGENFAITGRRRKDLGRVFKFAPFADDSHCFNPFDFIRDGDNAWDDAAMLADMIIVPSGAAKAVFFEQEARALLTALILYVWNEAPASYRNLSTVRRLVMLGGEAMTARLADMEKSANPIVRRAAASFTQKDPKLQTSILAEVQVHTQIWDSARVQRVTSRSDFSMAELKEWPMSLFLIIPPEALSVYRPLMRLMLGLAVRAMTQAPAQATDPVLFLVDEFPALGHMTPLEEGIAYLAGYGCRLWLFAQDLGQLESVYGEHGTRSIVANTNLQAFGNTDMKTLRMLSDLLGSGTVAVKNKSKARHSLLLPDYHNFSMSAGETSRPLLTPDEIRCLGDDRELLLLRGVRPILARKEPYYRQWRYRGLFDTWR